MAGLTNRVRRSIAALAVAAPLLIGAAAESNTVEGRWLAAHNRVRAEVGLPPLVWSSALAASAQGWAAHLARTGGFQHYRPSADDPDPQGENLWAGTRGYYAPEDMVRAWADERRHFVNARVPANSTTGRFGDVGHYVQLVWRKTDEVGCAMARGAEEDVLVCRYGEGGNVIGERPY